MAHIYPASISSTFSAFLAPTTLPPSSSTSLLSSPGSSLTSTKPIMPSHHAPRRKPPTVPRSPSTVQAAAATTDREERSLERSQRNGSRYRAFAYPPVRTPTRSAQPLKDVPSLHPAKANKHYVFVYGTLKKGFANSYFLDRATFLGDFRTQVRYPLVVGGRFNSPYLLDIPKKGAKVKGEVYAVDDATLADLDHLENIGVNYSRKVGKVSNCADRAFVADVFIYFKTNMLEELSKKPFVEDYQCRKYVPRHLRPAEKAVVGARR